MHCQALVSVTKRKMYQLSLVHFTYRMLMGKDVKFVQFSTVTWEILFFIAKCSFLRKS